MFSFFIYSDTFDRDSGVEYFFLSLSSRNKNNVEGGPFFLKVAMKWCLVVFALMGFCQAINVWDVLKILGLPKDPDSKLDVPQLIRSKGYPVANYTVQTADGYILGLQRIPSGRHNHNYHHHHKKTHNGNKPVVFLQHGLLSSAADWVLNFPDQSLAFLLADAGYDVWLGNVRGNTYSRRHATLSPDSDEFWQFSFDEMAEYDLPAMIEFVLGMTGQKDLYYVAHSQGTTMGFALLSQHPVFAEKIRLFAALAPVTTVGHMRGALHLLAPFTSDIDFLFHILGVKEFLPNDAVMKYLSEILCDTTMRFLCEDIIFLICGTDHSQLNATRLGVYVSHTPAGASTQSIVHFAQMINAKTFQKYDWGKKVNLLRYNQTTPPLYQVERVPARVALWWSENDKLADPTDVAELQPKLQNLVSSTRVNLTQFNHLDFVWGVDANKLVYDDLLALLKKY